MEWSRSFYDMRAGIGCPLCGQGRPEETPRGARFFAGEAVDGHLRRADVQRGLSIVIWHGRHVVEPTQLNPNEAMRLLIEKLEKTRTNAEFLLQFTIRDSA